MHRHRVIVALLALAGGLALYGLLNVSSSPRVVWHGTFEEGFMNKPSVRTKVRDWARARAARWFAIHPREKPMIEVAMSMRDATPEMIVWLSRVTAAVTNDDGTLVWVLAPEDFVNFKERRPPQRSPMDLTSRREFIHYSDDSAKKTMHVSQGIGRSLMSLPPGVRPNSECVEFHYVPSARRDSIALKVGATLDTPSIAPDATSQMIRTNLSFALTAKVANGGGLLICLPSTGSQSPRVKNFLLLLSPRLVDAKLNPLKPDPKLAKP